MRNKVVYVLGPKGDVITAMDLPPVDTTRWVASRKAIVVAAVNGGLLSLENACSRYALSTAEFLLWTQAIDRHGVDGLKATQLGRKSKQEKSPTTKRQPRGDPHSESESDD